MNNAIMPLKPRPQLPTEIFKHGKMATLQHFRA